MKPIEDLHEYSIVVPMLDGLSEMLLKRSNHAIMMKFVSSKHYLKVRTRGMPLRLAGLWMHFFREGCCLHWGDEAARTRLAWLPPCAARSQARALSLSVGTRPAVSLTSASCVVLLRCCSVSWWSFVGKVIMEALRRKSSKVQSEAFHILKVFVVNPMQPFVIRRLLAANSERLQIS
jgi:hypothetical protein